MVKLKMQCIHGFDYSQKRSLQMGSKGLWSLYSKKVGDYVEKWFILYLSQIVVHEVINQLTVLFDCAL